MSARIVALHGFTAAPSMWQAAIPEAEAPALLGHGSSAPPDASREFWGEVDRIAGALRRDGGPRAHIVGYSMGARVALGVAIRHRDAVGRVTLIGANPGLADEAARRDRRDWEAGWIRLLEREGSAAFADAWEALPLWESQRALPEEVLAAQRQARRAHDPRGLAAALAALGLGAMPNLWPELPSLTAPTHVIAGSRDRKFVDIAQRMADRLPEARVSTVPGAGHNPVLEAPRAMSRMIRGEGDTEVLHG